MADNLSERFTNVVLHAALSPAYGAVAVIGWQVLMWLKQGTWHAMSGIDLLVWLGIGKAEWLAQPTTWIGVWKVLDWLPASLMLTLLLILTLPIAKEILDDHAKRRAANETG